MRIISLGNQIDCSPIKTHFNKVDFIEKNTQGKRTQTHTLTQRILAVASIALTLFGIALAIGGKPLIGLTIGIAAIGIGFFLFTCSVFNPSPIPAPLDLLHHYARGLMVKNMER